MLSILDEDADAGCRPGPLRTEVFVEVPSSDNVQPLHVGPHATVHWLPRDGRGEIRGRLALETAMSADLPPGRFTTFVASESGLSTALRRHLIRDRGAARADISFMGY